MVRKDTLYSVATLAWAVVVGGAGVLVVSGKAAPMVSPTTIPGGPIGGIGTIAGGVILGAYAIDRVRARDWVSTGRAAGLTSTSGGTLWGQATMDGTVEGRTVRARVNKRKESSGGESGSSKKAYTVVEADLDAAAEDGLLVGRTPPESSDDPGSGISALGENFGSVATVSLGEGFWAVADDEDLARAVLTDRVRNAFHDLERVDGIYVGDAGGVLEDAVAEATGSGLGGMVAGSVASLIAGSLPGDATRVSYETRGLLLDGDEMAGRARAVAAVADAFEAATREGW